MRIFAAGHWRVGSRSCERLRTDWQRREWLRSNRRQRLEDSSQRIEEIKSETHFSQERAAARRLEAAAREIEAQKRQKAMDISGNKLDLSGEARKNKVIVAKQRQ